MQDFMKALTSERKSTALPEEFDYFGKLIGSWQINYVESNSSRVIKGEWHFSRVLEGMAVQDVILQSRYTRLGCRLWLYGKHNTAGSKKAGGNDRSYFHW